MKKYIAFLFILLLPLTTFAATYSPNPVAAGCSNSLTLDATAAPTAGNQIVWFNTNGTWASNSSLANFGSNTLTAYGFTVCNNGIIHFIYTNTADPSWSGNSGIDTYAQAITRAYYAGVTQTLTVGSGLSTPFNFGAWFGF